LSITIDDIIEEHSRFIYFKIYKVLNASNNDINIEFIDEIFQSFCEKMLKKSSFTDSYDSSKSSFLTWLGKIIENFIKDILKSNNKHRTSFYTSDEPIDLKNDIDILLFQNDFQKMDEKSLLTDRESLIIKLFFFKELTLVEISDLLKVSDSTIRVQKLNALRKMREYYNE